MVELLNMPPWWIVFGLVFGAVVGLVGWVAAYLADTWAADYFDLHDLRRQADRA